MDHQQIEEIVREVVLRILREQPALAGKASLEGSQSCQDITKEDITKWDFVHGAHAPEFAALKKRTPARLAVGHAGTRYQTHTRLRFLADHAAAKDAVDSELTEDSMKQYSLPMLQSLCASREEYITRPDLGRRLSKGSVDTLRTLCPKPIDICIFLADGLSANAIIQNGMDTLLTARAALETAGLRVAAPFTVRYGRVNVMDEVAETLRAAVTCVLIGERPGLGVADSMSAYAAYGATVGMNESRRTVISNIHSMGTPAIEAGAWLAELLRDMYATKLSGVELRAAQNRGTIK